jgi:protein SCO1
MKRYRPFIVLFAVLVLPPLVYLSMKLGGTQKYRPIETIGDKIPNPDGSLDSVFKPIASFTFLTHRGDSLTREMLKGKILVINLFYTKCAGECDGLNAYVQKMLTVDFARHPEVVFLSLSVDPVHDSLPALRAYSERVQASDRWYFLTAEPDQLRKFLVEELHYPAFDEGVTATNGLYNRSLRLVDWNGNLRGQFYQGDSEPNMVTMAQHIVLLLKEWEEVQTGNHPGKQVGQ